MLIVDLVGWVSDVGALGEYSRQIEIRSDKDDSLAKFPQHFDVTVRKSKYGIVPPDLVEDDKVRMSVYPVTRKGVSKAGKQYAITELILSKIEIIDKSPKKVSAVNDSDEELPF